ncbi:MAG: phosphotransferase [Bryobacterales bacterium]|nr:phosphotransferase [Bryobacterales bacterium]
MMPPDIEDPGQLLAYLRTCRIIPAREVPRFSVLHGGVSNRTVLVVRPGGEEWVAKQALEKLRVKDDWFSRPERIVTEAAGMEALARIAPPGSITRLIHLDRKDFILIMQAVPRPHENWKSMLLAGRLVDDHFEQFARLLASIHAGGATPEMARQFADRSIFESLRLEPYYAKAAERVPRAAGFLRALIEETRTRQVTLVHGDFSPKNVLVHQQRLVLLDHEVIHFGDPAFDSGFAMAHLLSKANHVEGRRQDFARAAAAFWQVYRTAGGLAQEQHSVRHALGCLLARVHGRSPLEYLTREERARQSASVVGMMERPPLTMHALIGHFEKELS